MVIFFSSWIHLQLLILDSELQFELSKVRIRTATSRIALVENIEKNFCILRF